MIVDDEKQIIDGLCKMIKWEEFDFEVCNTTRNGTEAISLIKLHKPDLVMTDVRMPEMDGLEMLRYSSHSFQYAKSKAFILALKFLTPNFPQLMSNLRLFCIIV